MGDSAVSAAVALLPPTRSAGVKFLPVDLRYSQAEVTVEGYAIRLGLSYIANQRRCAVQ